MLSKISIFIKYDLPSSVTAFIDLSLKKFNSTYSNCIFKELYPQSHKIEISNKVDKLSHQYNMDINNIFTTRTQKHIDTVIYLGQLFGLDFIQHDWLKLYDKSKRDVYTVCTMSKLLNYELTNTERFIFRKIAAQHKKTNPHHPEYWWNTNLMPNKYLIEMVCDWHALTMEGKFSNNPWIMPGDTMSFYLNTALAKHKFQNWQRKLIVSTIEKLEKETDQKIVQNIWQR